MNCLKFSYWTFSFLKSYQDNNQVQNVDRQVTLYSYLVYYEVQIKIPVILKYIFPVFENIIRKKTAVYETKGRFKRHMNRAT